MLIRKMKTKNQDKRITTYVLITTLQLKNTLRHNLPRLNVYIVLQFEKKNHRGGQKGLFPYKQKKNCNTQVLLLSPSVCLQVSEKALGASGNHITH